MKQKYIIIIVLVLIIGIVFVNHIINENKQESHRKDICRVYGVNDSDCNNPDYFKVNVTSNYKYSSAMGKDNIAESPTLCTDKYGQFYNCTSGSYE